MRNLLILILLFIAAWWLRGALRRFKDKGGFGARAAGRKPAVPERMLECSHCGIIVPESEGVHSGEAFYCCDAHRHAGPRGD